MKVEFYRHDLGSAEIDSITRALTNIFLTAGPLTQEFEQQFAYFLNCKKAVGTFSCTTALFLCLKALGIGKGDEVITTPLTFIATPNAIIQAGATPVFVDAEEKTGNIDVKLIQNAITSRTRSILPVHLYGHMSDMRRIRDIANRHKLNIIEDAAHCIEGNRGGIRPGSISDAACFSFYATKNITSGEGGAVVTNNEELADKILLLRSHGMNKEVAERYDRKYQHWDMVSFGYKGNMFDIQAALLLPQLRRLKNKLKRRQEIFERYRAAFRGVDNIDYPDTISGTEHACHLFTIWVDPKNRDGIMLKLQEMGIGVAANYRPVHLLTYYRRQFAYQEGSFPVAELIGKRTISLPLYPSMGDDAVTKVIEAVKKAL